MWSRSVLKIFNEVLFSQEHKHQTIHFHQKFTKFYRVRLQYRVQFRHMDNIYSFEGYSRLRFNFCKTLLIDSSILHLAAQWTLFQLVVYKFCSFHMHHVFYCKQNQGLGGIFKFRVTDP